MDPSRIRKPPPKPKKKKQPKTFRGWVNRWIRKMDLEMTDEQRVSWDNGMNMVRYYCAYVDAKDLHMNGSGLSDLALQFYEPGEGWFIASMKQVEDWYVEVFGNDGVDMVMDLNTFWETGWDSDE